MKLTPKALAMLCYLVDRAGQVVIKEDLFQSVWADTVVSDGALTVCIQEVRRVLRDDATQPRYIETVHRRGFRFIGKVVSIQSSVVGQEEGVSREDENPTTKDRETKEADEPPSVFSPSLQPEAHSLSQDSAPSPQDFNSPPFYSQPLAPSPQPLVLRLWPRKSLVLVAVLLLVSTGLTVHYLSRLTLSTQSSTLVTEEAQPLSLPLPDKPSIVVMPFTNMSGDPEQEYFSDGITEDLTTDLSKLSGLFVIARNSAFTYKGKAVKVQEVSRELGVRYVLEGSVRKTGSQVLVTVQLIDAFSGQHLWAERYDRPLQHIFALQGEIERKIVAYLALRLTKEESERTWSQYLASYTSNPEAYDSYMRGREYLYRNSKEVHARSRQLFERAIALDPTYAVASVGLGFTYLQEWMFQWSQDPEALEQAFALAQKALALDDSLPTAHLLLGRVYQATQQHEQAVAEAERAVALAPNYASGYATLGQILNAAGRPTPSKRRKRRCASTPVTWLSPYLP